MTRTIRIPNILGKINYIRAGSGKPVVLIHGIAASLHDWDEMSFRLNEAGCETFALDLPGHGNSDKPEDIYFYHIGNFVSLLVDWIDLLKLETAPILIGHSMGGYLALEYALRYPSFTRALVLIDPFFSPEQIPVPLRAGFNSRFLATLQKKEAPVWQYDFAVDCISFLNPGAHFLKHDLPRPARKQMSLNYRLAAPAVLELPFTARNLEPFLPQLSLPVLVIYGERDLTLSPKSFARLVNILPNAKGVGIKAGHVPHLSNAGEVNLLVKNFVDRLSVPS